MPITVMAQSYSAKIGNQTVSIIIKPNNTVIVDTDKIAQVVQQLQEKSHTDWNYGDLIIGSSTIIAFFGFGSLMVLKFEIGSPIPTILRHLRTVFDYILLIIGIQLTMIALIISKLFDPSFYLIGILLTFILMMFILKNMLIITRLNNQASFGSQALSIVQSTS